MGNFLEEFMKKCEGLFQIGEVAALCGITRKMILNYEDLGLLTPTTADVSSGYRYYDIQAISRVQTILDLRQVGMSLSEIRQYLNGGLSAESRIAALEEQRRQLDFMLAEMKARAVKSGEYAIEEILLPETVCLCTDYVAADIADGLSAYIAAYEECITRKIPFAAASYHFCEFPGDVCSEAFFQTENIPMRICISVDKKKAPSDAVVYPACRALSLVYRGTYENSISAYERLQKYIREHEIQGYGYPREMYVQGDFDADSEENLVRIAVPVMSEKSGDFL
ncbi:putative Transcriptional regulator, MerR family [uncultured Eubacteriales bacterium]|uniref:Putative Transcriptional regulator, MerR family n=1 Tax=uncultured Eubacteriales bacterium TaxID=172733 RepID=A0A212K7L6_9FIRM|nr:putative Transcriptional regulator, MerR family [uncultured Eubacteriales bacterium]